MYIFFSYEIECICIYFQCILEQSMWLSFTLTETRARKEGEGHGQWTNSVMGRDETEESCSLYEL